MKKLKDFYDFSAKDSKAMGQIMGEEFKDFHLIKLKESQSLENWGELVKLSAPLLEYTSNHAPEIYSELVGRSEATGIEKELMWAMFLEDEVSSQFEKCTTFITSDGRFLCHNEDWSPEAVNEVSMIKRATPNGKTLELFYINSFGGNSISLNSHGIIQAINTLSYKGHQLGLPKNVYSRVLADENSLKSIQSFFETNKRSSGYHHTFYDIKSNLGLSVECTDKDFHLKNIEAGHCHANHFENQKLISFEKLNKDSTSKKRLIKARELSTESDLELLKSRLLSESPLYSNKTIASLIIDLKTGEFHYRLTRNQGDFSSLAI